MATTPHRRRAHERGTTLLEAMIALTILLVGMVGMLKLQVYGMATTQGARAHTVASELAVELANAIALLPATDGRLSGSAKADGSAPTVFGALLPLGVPTTGVHVYDDANPIPQTRLDASLERDPIDPSKPVYRRRWTVWNAATTARTSSSAKIVAVSVIWRERTLPNPREVVAYVHSEIRGSFMADINAIR